MAQARTLKEKLEHLTKQKQEVMKMAETSASELKRRNKERDSILEILDSQRDRLGRLYSEKAKIVSLGEVKTLKIAIKMNNSNLTSIDGLIKQIKHTQLEEQGVIQKIDAAISQIKKEIDQSKRGVILPFPRKKGT